MNTCISVQKTEKTTCIHTNFAPVKEKPELKEWFHLFVVSSHANSFGFIYLKSSYICCHNPQYDTDEWNLVCRAQKT